jgi:endonuclease YncB( thermonuclease family)
MYSASSVSGVLAAVLFVLAASDETAPPIGRLTREALAGPVEATVERVVDGDTIDVTAHIWLGQTLSVRVRIAGVDTPELEARCEQERRMALAARDYLARRVMGTDVTLTQIVYDKYGGRVRADVADTAGDIGHALLSAGFARPYHGERRRSWCEAA